MIKDRDVMKAVDIFVNEFANLEDMLDQLNKDNLQLISENQDLGIYIVTLKEKIKKLEEEIIELQLTGKADEPQK